MLNNRGRVSSETEEKVRKMAAELGYKPNSLGKALASRKKHYIIGVILCSEGNEFYNDMIRGIEQAEQDNTDYGINVLFRTMKGYDVDHQLRLMNELEGRINCLLITAINHHKIAQKINSLTESGIGVLTLNTDIENSKRVCHIGANVIESGRIACGLLGLLMRGKAQVAIATNSLKLLEHHQRIEGFLQAKEDKYPGFHIVEIFEAEDDDMIAYMRTKKLLAQKPGVDAFYIGGAALGICRAIEEAGCSDKITIISCDTNPTVVRLMNKGMIKAAICQQPWHQGYKAINIAVQYLVNGISKSEEYCIIDNQIKILENIDTLFSDQPLRL